MRISISGSASQGKTTLINDILKEWPTYKKSGESYRRLITEGKIKHSRETTKESQGLILDCLVDDVKNTRKGDKVIFDRCPLDNIVYSMWANEKGVGGVDDDFVRESIEKAKEAMRAIDIIFFLPITKVAPVPIVQREGREIDPTFISEIDNIFKAISYAHQRGPTPFFVKDDAPPIIEIFGSPRERIEMLKWYINVDGDLVDTVASVLSNENISTMESLLHDQQFALESEQAFKNQKDKIIKAPFKGKQFKN